MASFLFAWAISYFFADSLSFMVYDKEVDKYVLKYGTKIRWRSEGWATTVVGPHGITGLYDENIEKKPIIAVWGDSHVEGFHVDDMEKVGSVITIQCLKNENCEYAGINIGLSGQSIADYYFAIPKYEKVFPNISRHYIVIPSIEDVLPDNDAANHAKFLSKPNFRFEKDDYRPVAPELKEKLYTFGLDFVWYLAKRILKENSFRFSLQVAAAESKAQKREIKDKVPSDCNDAWHFLLSELSSITKKPLTFVYCPSVPFIKNGKLCFEDPRQSLALKFEKICAEYQIGFINLENEFLHYYKRAGLFPFGFPNTHPALGHLNSRGHLILANEILKHAMRDEG